MSAPNIETIVSLAKRRGFVFPSSEIYGGLGSAWDYGPLGVELCNNVKQGWWRWMVHERDDMEGLDSSIILNRLVWKYSGHEDTFSDPLIDCKECKSRFRADKLTEQVGAPVLGFDFNDLKCPNCGKTNWTDPRPFNLMFRTTIGAAAEEDDPSALAYLRPETAQGIFINFLNVLTTSRRKLPFGIAQIGKSFRNEVTPGNFIFRTREFEQMEMEYFVRPGEDEQVHQEWIDYCYEWFKTLGISADNLRLYEQPKEELAHYAKRTVDIHYRFFPEREEEERQWDELMGIANRTDFDLKAHSKKPEQDGERINKDSTEDLSYFDEATKERFYPY
ncbi:MAG TPA: glycine--tRNA ligase, partial [Pyrinomonadaceae bacterium]